MSYVYKLISFIHPFIHSFIHKEIAFFISMVMIRVMIRIRQCCIHEIPYQSMYAGRKLIYYRSVLSYIGDIVDVFDVDGPYPPILILSTCLTSLTSFDLGYTRLYTRDYRHTDVCRVYASLYDV